jgi:hypothetical protein
MPRVLTLTMAAGAGWLYDQLREIPRGIDPNVLVEWSDIIERKANEGSQYLNSGRVKFKGTVNGEGRFALDVNVSDPDAVVRLLTAIQDNLTLMPTSTRQFYGSVMLGIASEAEEKDSLGKDS